MKKTTKKKKNNHKKRYYYDPIIYDPGKNQKKIYKQQ
jgi:hypothetical protein